jgi:hypothetical protein
VTALTAGRRQDGRQLRGGVDGLSGNAAGQRTRQPATFVTEHSARVDAACADVEQQATLAARRLQDGIRSGNGVLTESTRPAYNA